MKFSKKSAGTALAIMLLVSFAIRIPEAWHVSGAPNLEASYHVLLTATALLESPVHEHLLLPTVTLGNPLDKGMTWGATVPTAYGHYIYTSFPPLGFWGPALFFKVLGVTPSLFSLTLFNFLLQVLACAALYTLLIRLLNCPDITLSQAREAALAGVAVQIFASEALLSFGIVYWCQQIFQLILILHLHLLLSVLVGRSATGIRVAALGLLVFLGILTEWTGFTLAGGTIAILVFRGWREPGHLWIAAMVGLAALLGVLFIALHLAAGVGPHAAFQALASRFMQRSAVQGTPMGLLMGYAQSYGLLLLIVPLAAAVCLRPLQALRGMTLGSAPAAIFACSLFALAENVLLMQHATQFSFDRLKLAVPLAMMTACAVSRSRGNWRPLLAIGLVLALVQNYWSYAARLASQSEWVEIERGNRSIAEQIAQRLDLTCAVIGTNVQVRGYPVLLFHRGIHEGMTKEQWHTLPHAAGCARVWLEGIPAPRTNLPRFTEAFIEGPMDVHVLPR